ncbi:hypothetical protein AB0L10_22100 [Streptomyces flaveolus]|uniref:hypothetical protein n=1 Tax=Streptomyces flaveolus TaxID=67297 RepID=UPI003426F3CE
MSALAAVATGLVAGLGVGQADKWPLPVPYVGAAEVRNFEEHVAEPRALRRRYSRDTTAR